MNEIKREEKELQEFKEDEQKKCFICFEGFLRHKCLMC
jgi:hypothetical protein